MRTAVGIIAACALSALVQAQESPDAPPAESKVESTGEARKVEASLQLYTDYTFSSDLDDGEGEASVWRAGAALDMSFPVGGRSSVGASFRGERWGFDMQDATEFDSADGEPWDDVTNLAMLLSFRHKCNDRWSASVGGGIEAAFADGAEFGDSVMYGGFVTTSYKFSDSFTGGLGVSVRTRIEDDVFVVPFLILDWKLAEKWRLSTRPGISRRLIGLAYTPCDPITITFGGGYERLDFRLDDEAPAPKGVGRYERIPLGLEVTWNITPQVGLSVYGGASVYQQYELDNEDGDEIAQDDAGVAPFLGAGLEWKF